jgi:hypothetical protein
MITLRSFVIAGFLCAGFAQCAAPIREFYPDAYSAEKREYRNDAIGFSFVLSGSWDIVTNPNMMGEHKSAAKLLQKTSAGEFLFIGNTTEKTQGIRGVAVNLNMPNEAYAGEIRRVNPGGADSGLVNDTIARLPMVRWIYEKERFVFMEFFFRVDTYNVRIAFWTTPEIFPNFRDVYRQTMETLILTR